MVGPPGSGKTAVAAALAVAMGLPIDRIDAGGLADNRDLAGTSAGWSSAQPSRPVMAIVQSRVANPLLLVDEVEKASAGSMNGSAQDTLLSMTEPVTAGSYHDEGLRARVDISHITWAMTANVLSAVPKPLKSRLAIIRVDRPGPAFADRTIELVLAGIAREMGGTADMMPDLPPAVLDQVRKHFAGGADLRRVKAALRAAVSLEMDAAVLH
jgi:MoxR-like ATPase